MPGGQEIYTVSLLNQEARELLEGKFQTLWLTGEISNLARPSSGHFYFSLKDEMAQVRCAMFRNSHRLLRFIPENGQHVLARASVSLYEARGEFQLIIQDMQLSGEGLLQIAFEKLKAKLSAEGLFNPEHKKPIPEFPKQIGVITSASGAAIHDILTVLKRRFPCIPVILYSSSVQGELAAKQLIQALKTAEKRQECDVLILARGGGSLEDLWSFNDEALARAIFAAKIPIITGIGHEVDFTIADFVADFRAATPSAAAEQACPDQKKWQEHFLKFQRHLRLCILQKIKQDQMHLAHLLKRLRHPGQKLRDQAQRLDRLEMNLILAYQNKIKALQSQFDFTKQHFFHLHPEKKIESAKEKIHSIKNRLLSEIKNEFQHWRQTIQSMALALDTLNPLRTLQRGYAILNDSHNNKIIDSVNLVSEGDYLKKKMD